MIVYGFIVIIEVGSNYCFVIWEVNNLIIFFRVYFLVGVFKFRIELSVRVDIFFCSEIFWLEVIFSWLNNIFFFWRIYILWFWVFCFLLFWIFIMFIGFFKRYFYCWWYCLEVDIRCGFLIVGIFIIGFGICMEVLIDFFFVDV